MADPETHAAFALRSDYADAEGFDGSFAYGPDGVTVQVHKLVNQASIVLGKVRKLDNEGLPVNQDNGEPVMVDNVVQLGPDGYVVTDDAALVAALDLYPAFKRVPLREAGVTKVSAPYDAATKSVLEAEVQRRISAGRSITVNGTGADGAVTKDDLVAALNADDGGGS